MLYKEPRYLSGGDRFMTIEFGELQTAGNRWKVLVKPVDKVQARDALFIMEVMKMEVPHVAPAAGTLTAVNVSTVEEGLNAGMMAVMMPNGCNHQKTPRPSARRSNKLSARR